MSKQLILQAAPLRSLSALLLASLFWLPACSREDAPIAADNLTAQATRDGASVAVQIETDELRTVDRLWVSVRAVAPAGQIAREIVFEPEAAGWTLVSQSVPVVSLTPRGDAVRTVEYVLEPFLDGEYVVPAAAGVFAAPGAIESVSLSTEPLPVRVNSVLPEDASVTDLAPAAASLEVPPIRAPRSVLPWLASGLVLVAAGTALAAWRLSRAQPGSPPSVADQLQALRNRLPQDPMEARDQIARTLRSTTLVGNSGGDAMDRVLQTLDRERFAGRAACESDVEDLLAAAITAATQTPPKTAEPSPHSQGATA